MTALRARGGDVPVALRRPLAEVARPPGGRPRRSPAGLGDRARRGGASPPGSPCSRPAGCSWRAALARAERGLARARAVGSPRGRRARSRRREDGARLPRGRGTAARGRRRARAGAPPAPSHTWLLQWTVFESAFVAAADARLGRRRPPVEEAVELNRRTGFPAYAGYFPRTSAGSTGWPAISTRRSAHGRARARADLAGGPPVVVRHRRRAALRHPAGGRDARGTPPSSPRQGLASTGPETPEAWRLRCAGPAGGGDRGRRTTWTPRPALLAGVDCPPGGAWVVGSGLLPAARAARTSSTATRTAPSAGSPPWRPPRERHWQPGPGARSRRCWAQISSATS